jgi:hypothetical protein
MTCLPSWESDYSQWNKSGSLGKKSKGDEPNSQGKKNISNEREAQSFALLKGEENSKKIMSKRATILDWKSKKDIEELEASLEHDVQQVRNCVFICTINKFL